MLVKHCGRRRTTTIIWKALISLLKLMALKIRNSQLQNRLCTVFFYRIQRISFLYVGRKTLNRIIIHNERFNLLGLSENEILISLLTIQMYKQRHKTHTSSYLVWL